MFHTCISPRSEVFLDPNMSEKCVAISDRSALRNSSLVPSCLLQLVGHIVEK